MSSFFLTLKESLKSQIITYPDFFSNVMNIRRSTGLLGVTLYAKQSVLGV
jgi:hypothetical protein